MTVTGLAPDDAGARPWTEIAPPADRAELVGALAFAQEIGGAAAEFRFERRDATIWLDLAVSAVRRPSGELEEFSGTVVDATQRRARAVDLDRFQAVAETTSDLVLVADDDGSVAYINPAARAWFGVEGDDLVTGDVVPASLFELYYAEIRPALLRTNRWPGAVELRGPTARPAGGADGHRGNGPGSEVRWLVWWPGRSAVPVGARRRPPAADVARRRRGRAARRRPAPAGARRQPERDRGPVRARPRVDGPIDGVAAVPYLHHRDKGLVPVRDALGGRDPGSGVGARSGCRC